MFGGELLELAQSHVAFDGWWMLCSLSHSGEALLGEVPLSYYSLLPWPPFNTSPQILLIYILPDLTATYSACGMK